MKAIRFVGSKAACTDRRCARATTWVRRGSGRGRGRGTLPLQPAHIAGIMVQRSKSHPPCAVHRHAM